MAEELEELHLADLHERAAEAGISGYRLMRREELIAALSGAGDAAPEADGERDSEPEPEQKTRRRRRGRRRRKPEPDAESDSDTDTDPESDTYEMAVVEATVLDDTADEPAEVEQGGAPDADLPTADVTGVLELTRQRYGFVRLAGLAPSEDDVYISAAPARR